MKKSVMVLLAVCAGTGAIAEPRSPMDTLLTTAAKRPAVSIQLLRASGACGPMSDCYSAGSGQAYALATEPCASTPFGCQLSSSHNEWKRSSYVGGARFSTDIGKMSFSAGRHRDNLVLSQATFLEGTYRVAGGSLAFGVLRAPRLEGSNLVYIAYRLAL